MGKGLNTLPEKQTSGKKSSTLVNHPSASVTPAISSFSLFSGSVRGNAHISSGRKQIRRSRRFRHNSLWLCLAQKSCRTKVPRNL